MNLEPSPPSWTPIKLLSQRFLANVRALALRDPALADALRAVVPAREYFIHPGADHVQLGARTPAGIMPVAHPLLPAQVKDLVQRLYKSGACNQPLMIAGEDMGWLWNAAYSMPCNVAGMPGHRPPLYFLISDPQRLWVMLHVHDWRTMLADARVKLLAGPDAIAQLRQSMAQDTIRPWPKLCVTADQSLWPAGVTLDTLLRDAQAQAGEKLSQLNQRVRLFHGDKSAGEIAALYASDKPLNVLGITSLYTTFLQHSMRDWLAAFERLGHRTRLLIENHDHEISNNLATASACAEFKPDLIVVIDHYRREFGSLPEGVPVAMWVQDALPNLFTPAAGAAQGERDYALGFARLRMIHEFGYPATRYMPAIVGVNEERFRPRTLSLAEQAQFGCDVSFVSHASTPAKTLLQEEIQRINSPDATRLLSAIFEQLQAVYAAGGMISEPASIRAIIDRTFEDLRLGMPRDQMPPLMDLFTQRINNALFRHQSLEWVAQTGANLHLYGRGWENHPTLRRFARGAADNFAQLPLIYQASKISLQISPHGAVHQRLMEGLAAGGFFLMRYCPGDVLEREFAAIWDWCAGNGIAGDHVLRERATADINQRLDTVAKMLQSDPFREPYSFVETLRSSAEAGYMRSAGTIWSADYDAICYRSADELAGRISHYLSNPVERRARADSMRRAVFERFTYQATTRRLLRFIADDQASHAARKAAA